MKRVRERRRGIEKCPTGIGGLDEITGGGLPRGRPTLVCGRAGCGKTVLAMEFLVRGASQFHEPGVFVSFEESEADVGDNVASMGFDVPQLCARRLLHLERMRVERRVIEESGAYDLEGLFVRLEQAIQEVKAKRVVLDTIEALFSGFSDASVVRAELCRLFDWLKQKGMSALVTAESGEGSLTRYGIEEYVADCVLVLDHRVEDEMSIRRLRVLKYRGTLHGTNEYPFLIGESGVSVLPLSSLKLEHAAPTQRVSSGIAELDGMLAGPGFFRGSSILVTGTAGTGKSSLAAHFVEAACRRGERALYMATEQSGDEVVRNMGSIGIDLRTWMRRGGLKFYACRPGTFGLEKHLTTVHELVSDFDPKVVVVDPVTNFGALGSGWEVKSMITRLIDLFKARQITALFTSLTAGGSALELSEVGVSSLMDVWILLRNLESDGERNRGLYVLKARGIAHSNQVREFKLTDHGMKLLQAYVGGKGLLTGSARLAEEARERADAAERKQQLRSKQAELRRKRQELEAHIARLRSEFRTERQELREEMDAMRGRQRAVELSREEMGRVRQVGAASGNGRG